MDDTPLVPVNLAFMGIKRLTAESADLITIWKTPYPVLTNYKKICHDLGLRPFAGGTFEKQGSAREAGFITSGYRVRGGRWNSPHRFGLAIDVAIGDTAQQITAAAIALRYFTRIGLYPGNGFIHLDLANEVWMQRYGGRRYWVRKNDLYTSFDRFDKMIAFAGREDCY